ncbi:MAG: FtsX-like permease family protein [Chloroflexaceae bacterium]
MLSIPTQWRKTWRDFIADKFRSLLAILSIAVGAYAVSTVLRTQAILTRELQQSYLAIQPADARLTLSPFAADFVQSIDRIDGVQRVEGYTEASAHVLTDPHARLRLRLFAFPDFSDLQIDQIRPHAGQPVPPKGTILLEQSTAKTLNLQVGDRVTVETAGDKVVTLPVVGIVSDLTRLPTDMIDVAYGYITRETLETLGEQTAFTTLRLIVRDDVADVVQIKTIVRQVREKAERAGLRVLAEEIPEPGQPPLHNVIQASLLILGLVSLLALCLSVFLVTNTISALLARHIRQIGIMKAIGARRGQILRMYLLTVGLYGVCALALAIPPAIISSIGLAHFNAGFFNFNLESVAVPPTVWALEGVAGLGLPLLVALWPIYRGTRVTVQEAVSQTGTATRRFGNSPLDRLPGRLRFLNATLLYALRNGFRRKARPALVVLTLSTVSAIFITVVSLHGAFIRSIDTVSNYWRQDITLYLKQPYRTNRIEQVLQDFPGIVRTEPRGRGTFFRLDADGQRSTRSYRLSAFVQPTDFVQPTLLAGRWLTESDQQAIVVNSELLKAEPDMLPGQEVIFEIDDRPTRWQVVGVVTSQVLDSGGILTPIAYVNYPHFARLVGQASTTDSFLIETRRHDADFQTAVAEAMVPFLENHGIKVEQTRTYHYVLTQLKLVVNVLIYLLLILAVLFAIIGSLGLMSMMSINVLERTQEIGVIRALGAPGGLVRQIVVIEGVLVAGLSWALGTLLAIPLSKIVGDAVGHTFFSAPLEYTFSLPGVLLWLLIVVGLAIVSSILPAHSAAQTSVRQALSYA